MSAVQIEKFESPDSQIDLEVGANVVRSPTATMVSTPFFNRPRSDGSGNIIVFSSRGSGSHSNRGGALEAASHEISSSFPQEVAAPPKKLKNIHKR